MFKSGLKKVGEFDKYLHQEGGRDAFGGRVKEFLDGLQRDYEEFQKTCAK
jgi:hypothetical protein